MASDKTRTTIAAKMWILAITVFLLMAGLAAFTWYSTTTLLKDDFVRKSSEKVLSVSDKIAAPLWLHQDSYRDRILQTLENEPSVSFLYLTDPDGNHLYGFREAPFDSLLNAFQNHHASRQLTTNQFLLRHVVQYNEEPQGTLIAGFNMQQLNQQIATTEKYLMYALGGLALLVALLASILARSIAHPIRSVYKKIRSYKLAENTFDLRLKGRGSRELVRLVQYFNTLAQEVDHRFQNSNVSTLISETYFDESPIPILVSLPNGDIEKANQSAADFFEITIETLLKSNLESLLDGGDFHNIEKQINKSDKDINGYVTALLTERGQRRFVELNITLLRDSENILTHFMITIVNISEQVHAQQKIAEAQTRTTDANQQLQESEKRLRAALEKSKAELASMNHKFDSQQKLFQQQKLKSLETLIGGFAHEYNNILGIMNPNLDLLKTASGNDENVQKRAAVLQQAVDRAASLTRQLLIFSRNDNFELAPLSPNSLIKRLVPMLQKALGSNINARLELGIGIPDISADEVKLCQVLVNLAANARDAMPDGGELVFRTDFTEQSLTGHENGHREKYVRITIVDSGCGISKENLNHIFDPFFTTHDVGDWKGLGLSVAHGIMKGHEGEIRIESEERIGTTVHLYFKPLAADVNSQEIPEVKDPSEIPAPPNGNILVVDDEEMIRESLGEILKFLGYNVYFADGGEDALKIVRNGETIHVAIIDFEMPKMDGIETIKAIKEIDENIKIILSSGFANQEKVADASDSIQAFLPKPFQIDDLSDTMSEILRN